MRVKINAWYNFTVPLEYDCCQQFQMIWNDSAAPMSYFTTCTTTIGKPTNYSQSVVTVELEREVNGTRSAAATPEVPTLNASFRQLVDSDSPPPPPTQLYGHLADEAAPLS
jgi:hypothetical protein